MLADEPLFSLVPTRNEDTGKKKKKVCRLFPFVWLLSLLVLDRFLAQYLAGGHEPM